MSSEFSRGPSGTSLTLWGGLRYLPLYRVRIPRWALTNRGFRLIYLTLVANQTFWNCRVQSIQSRVDSFLGINLRSSLLGANRAYLCRGTRRSLLYSTTYEAIATPVYLDRRYIATCYHIICWTTLPSNNSRIAYSGCYKQATHLINPNQLNH